MRLFRLPEQIIYSQHGVVLDLGFAEGRGVFRDEDELGCGGLVLPSFACQTDPFRKLQLTSAGSELLQCLLVPERELV